MSTAVKDENNIPKYLEMLSDLMSRQILIGIFGEDDSEVLMYASVNEFGCNIEAKNTKNLAIPISKKARGKSPREFHDLFTLKTDDGSLYLVREKGKDKLEFLYWLTKSVKIPERSFIRGGFDENQTKINAKAIRLLKQVLSFELDVTTFYELLGEYIVDVLAKHLTKLKDPPDSNITTGVKGSSNPLIDTGRLRDSITFKVVKK